MPYGIPKTEEERKETHKAMFGTTELPPRGTRLQNEEEITGEQLRKQWQLQDSGFKLPVNEETMQLASHLANLLKVREQDQQLWYFVKSETVTNTTSQTIYSDRVKQNHAVKLKHVAAKESSNAPTTIEIAVERGGQTIVLERDTPSAADISVNFKGEHLMIEGDRLKVTFYGSTSSDTIDVSASGIQQKA